MKKFKLTPEMEFVLLVLCFFLMGASVKTCNACEYESPEQVEITIEIGQ